MQASADTDDALFLDALQGLHKGDFSRLEPLFDEQASHPGGRARIVDWHEAGRFGDDRKALAEALTCACFLGRTGVATHFLTHGIEPSGGAGTGLNAFHWAVNRGQLEAVRLLLQWHAPLETRSMSRRQRTGYGGLVRHQRTQTSSHGHHRRAARGRRPAGRRRVAHGSRGDRQAAPGPQGGLTSNGADAVLRVSPAFGAAVRPWVPASSEVQEASCLIWEISSR